MLSMFHTVGTVRYYPDAPASVSRCVVIDPDFLIEAQKVILDPKRILAQKEVQEYCSTAVLDRKLLDKLWSKAKIDEKLRETVIEFLIEDAFLYRLSHDKFLVPGLLPAVKDRQLEVKAPYPCRGMYVYDAEEKNYVNDEGAVMQLGEDGWDIVFATEVKHHLSKASFPPTGSWEDCTVQLGKHSGRLEALHFLNNNPPKEDTIYLYIGGKWTTDIFPTFVGELLQHQALVRPVDGLETQIKKSCLRRDGLELEVVAGRLQAGLHPEQDPKYLFVNLTFVDAGTRPIHGCASS